MVVSALDFHMAGPGFESRARHGYSVLSLLGVNRTSPDLWKWDPSGGPYTVRSIRSKQMDAHWVLLYEWHRLLFAPPPTSGQCKTTRASPLGKKKQEVLFLG